MGFRFQRRINLSGGWGLNTSGSGGSLSYRHKHGSIGTKGVSFRTGIPGLSYRQNWGKNSGAAVAIFALVFAVVVIATRVLVIVVPLLWQGVLWIVLTTHDLCRYGIQQMRGTASS